MTTPSWTLPTTSSCVVQFTSWNEGIPSRRILTGLRFGHKSPSSQQGRVGNWMIFLTPPNPRYSIILLINSGFNHIESLRQSAYCKTSLIKNTYTWLRNNDSIIGPYQHKLIFCSGKHNSIFNWFPKSSNNLIFVVEWIFYLVLFQSFCWKKHDSSN